MGTGGARGAGAHWARRRNFPRPAALRRAPGPRGRDHPACVPPRGAGGSGEAGRAATGGGEGGGSPEDDERRAALSRRLGGALPAPRAWRPHPRPAARSPQPALTRVRSSPAQPLHCEGLVAGDRRQLTFQTCKQGWCWCTPPPGRTHDPTSGAPASGRGRRPGPSPSPASAINWKQHL